jgi:hypothetical protein
MWSPTALSKALPETLIVKASVDSAHFMYTAEGHTGNLLADTIAPSSKLPVLATNFCASLAPGANLCGGGYQYFTAPVETLESRDGPLLERAHGWEQLTVHGTETFPRDYAHLACRPWLQLWAGSKGACTQAHYDVAEYAPR